jgi:methylmalonyl-CoA mutase
VNENIQAALDSGAEIVVLCSSDEEYASEAAGILSRLRKQNEELILVVAGYPKDILETLKSAGASEFIHVRSNLLGTLESFQEQLGIF